MAVAGTSRERPGTRLEWPRTGGPQSSAVVPTHSCAHPLGKLGASSQHHGAAPGVATALLHLALNLAGDKKVQPRQLLTQSGQCHQQLHRLWPAGVEGQLRRGVRLKDKKPARHQPLHDSRMHRAAQGRRQMRERGHDARPCTGRNPIRRQIGDLRRNHHPTRRGQAPRLRESNFRLIHRRHRMPERSEKHRVAPFALGQAKHRAGWDACGYFGDEGIGRLPVNVAGTTGIAVVPEVSIHTSHSVSQSDLGQTSAQPAHS